MKSPGLPWLAAAALLAATRLAAAEKVRLEPVPADQPIPVADFFRLPLLRNPVLNPSGSHVAALVSSDDDHSQLMVYDIAKQKVEIVRGAGDKDIQHFGWLNDQRLIASLTGEKLVGLGLLAADVGELDRAYPLLQFSGAQLVSVPRSNALRPLIWLSADMEDNHDRGVTVINSDLHAGDFIDLRRRRLDWSDGADLAAVRESNERHIVKTFPRPPGVGVRYLADRDGNLAFAVTEIHENQSLYRWTGDAWVASPVDPDDFDIVDSGNQPGELVVRKVGQNHGPYPLQFMDAVSGKPGAVVLEEHGYAFQEGWLYRDPRSRDIVGAIYERQGPHVVWFNDDYRDMQKSLNSAFPGQVVRILGSSEDGNLFLVMTFSDRHPAVFHWYDVKKHSLGLLKKAHPWIDPERMRPMNLMKVKTRDGFQLDAFLTLPEGAAKEKPAPLVVLSHGGPWQRDHWGFNGEVQFLASRGYAVLQTNYRGSLGTGWMFPEAQRNDFRKMHDDVTDATKAVLASGLVDPARVAIMGGSFGGYLAVSGIVNEPDLYRCAVTIAGVFDWEEFLDEKKSYQFEGRTYGYWKKRLAGAIGNFDRISPLRHVDRVRVPVLVAHGKEDQVVDISQSRELIAKLKQRNIPVDVILTGGEGHGMAHLDNQVELYTHIEAFLAKNLMGAK